MLLNFKINNGKIIGGYQSGAQITGEKIAGDLDSWNVYKQDINDALNLSYGILCQRSTSLYHSYAPLSSAINKTTAYAIGEGNLFRSHPDYRILGISREKARDLGKKIELLVHYKWLEKGWYEKQGVNFRDSLISGDSLVYFIREDGKPFDLIEVGSDDINWQVVKDNYTLGIKHDKYLRRQGIYTTAGDEISFKDANGDQNVIQYLRKEKARQLRGLPIGYKIIALAKNHERFTDAITQRAVVEAMFGLITKTDTPDAIKQMQAQAQANKARQEQEGFLGTTVSTIKNALHLGSSNMLNIKSNENVEFMDMKAPSNNFDKFNDWQVKLVAMATDTTAGVIMSNYPTSYSSHKGEFNDFKTMFMQKRKSYNVNVNNIIVRETVKELILDGELKLKGFFDSPLKQRAWLSGKYLGPVAGHINPLQEVNADEKIVKNSFKLRSDVAEKYDTEWYNTFSEWEDQERAFNALTLEQQEETIKNEMQNNKENK